MIARAIWPTVLCVLALTGCYHLRKPPQIDEPVSVTVVSNDERLVHSQGYMQSAAAQALVGRLGWQVSPSGSARLELALDQEDIHAVARDVRGIASQWAIRIRGRALLASRKGNLTTEFSGVGYASGLNDETEALRVAADNAAFNISAWLETAARKLK